VLLAGLVYWAFSVAVLSFGVYGDEQGGAASLPRLMHLLLSDEARWLVALIGYLACFASMNVYLQGFARLIWSLADEGKLPAPLAARNSHGVPAKALLLVVAICALCAVLASALQLSVDDLIRYANGNFILVYLLSMAAGVVLLRGIWRWVAAFSCLLCALVLLALGLDALYALGLLALIALLDRWREARGTPLASRG
jgi:amino acid efflux transporter